MDLEVKPLNFDNFQSLDNNKKNQGFSPTFLVVIIILILIIGTLLVIGQTKKLRETKKEESPQQLVEKKEQVTPTEKPKIDKKILKVKIINGTGTPGEAGKVSSLLVNEGFTKENIKTENANEFNNKITLIQLKKSYQEQAEEIKKIISNLFEEIKIETSFLDETDDYDIIITTGGKIYSSPTPTQEEKQNPTPTLTLTPTLTNTPTPTP